MASPLIGTFQKQRIRVSSWDSDYTDGLTEVWFWFGLDRSDGRTDGRSARRLRWRKGTAKRWMMGSLLLDVCLSQQGSVDGEWTEDGIRLA
ncbi:hypothetical protein YC2023_072193 [Brassica napus]